MCAYDDDPLVCRGRTIDANDLREQSGNEVNNVRWVGTDNAVLTPRMREFVYGNEAMQTLCSECVGSLWEHVGHRTRS